MDGDNTSLHSRVGDGRYAYCGRHKFTTPTLSVHWVAKRGRGTRQITGRGFRGRMWQERVLAGA